MEKKVIYLASPVDVSDDGQTVVVGSHFDAHSGFDFAGSVYVYRPDGGGVVETKLTSSDAAERDIFGESVAVSGDGETVIAGAPQDNNNSGSAYVFKTDSVAGIRVLREAVSALIVLPEDIVTGMLKQLTGAIRRLEDTNAKNDLAAVGKLQAFTNNVNAKRENPRGNAQRGKPISTQDADALIGSAADIVAEITLNLDQELLAAIDG